MGLVAREERTRAESSILRPHPPSWQRVTKGPGHRHLIQSPSLPALFDCAVNPPAGPFHTSPARGCLRVRVHEYAQPLGFETSQWLIPVGGLPLPLCWRKWRGRRQRKSQRKKKLKREKGERMRKMWPAGGSVPRWQGSRIPDRSPTFPLSLFPLPGG